MLAVTQHVFDPTSSPPRPTNSKVTKSTNSKCCLQRHPTSSPQSMGLGKNRRWNIATQPEFSRQGLPQIQFRSDSGRSACPVPVAICRPTTQGRRIWQNFSYYLNTFEPSWVVEEPGYVTDLSRIPAAPLYRPLLRCHYFLAKKLVKLSCPVERLSGGEHFTTFKPCMLPSSP